MTIESDYQEGRMNRSRMGYALRLAAVVALLSLSQAPPAESAGITSEIDYSTSATYGANGITGQPVVSFQGVSDGSLTTGSPFDLGRFVVAAPTSGQTTYDGTLITVLFMAKSVDGQPLASPATEFFSLLLTGTVQANGQSDLRYEVSNYIDEPLPYNAWDHGIQIGSLTAFIAGVTGFSGSIDVPPGGGSTGLQAVLHADGTVPEPSTWVIFASVGCLFALRRGFAIGKGRANA
jgi:hypothetical protein